MSKSIKAGRRPSRGFTLLEVVLALALGVIVLAALAMAVQVTLRATDTGRGDVARAQLARALLRRMGDDVRGTIFYQAVDVNALLGSASGAGGATGSGSSSGTGGTGGTGSGSSGTGSSGTGSSGTGSGSSGTSGGSGSTGSSGSKSGSSSSGSSSNSSSSGSSSSSSSSTSDTTSSDEVGSVPGLYGGPDWIELDVSRLPRIDQLAQAATGQTSSNSGGNNAAAMQALPSDVKTVSYYIDRNRTLGSGVATQLVQLSGGLVRRELDRAVTKYAVENGNQDQLRESAVTLAPEVIDLQFQYYDGTQWLTEWDSSSTKSLPKAVQIALAIANPGAAQVEGTVNFQQTASRASDPYTIYNLTVFLPASGIQAGEGSSSSTSDSSKSDSDSSGTSGSSGGSGSNGSGSSGSASSGSGGSRS